MAGAQGIYSSNNIGLSAHTFNTCIDSTANSKHMYVCMYVPFLSFSPLSSPYEQRASSAFPAANTEHTSNSQHDCSYDNPATQIGTMNTTHRAVYPWTTHKPLSSNQVHFS